VALIYQHRDLDQDLHGMWCWEATTWPKQRMGGVGSTDVRLTLQARLRAGAGAGGGYVRREALRENDLLPAVAELHLRQVAGFPPTNSATGNRSE